MISRRDRAAGLIALVLALALAGCAGQGGEGNAARAAAAAADPALAPLLGEAERAMAGGRLAEAGALLDRGLEAAPDDPDLWVAIARLRLRGGEHLIAPEAADRALALDPDHPGALLLRALMVRDAHGHAAALPWLAAGLRAAPRDPDLLAEHAATLGDGGAAGAMLEAVRRLPAGDPRAAYLQAVLAARGGEYALARALLDRSRMAEAGVPAAMQLDALVSLAQGHAGSAAATLETLAARQPANPRLRELLARALLLAGRAEEVAARFAAEAERPAASPYLVMLVARAHERIGDRERAAPLLARAYAARPPIFTALGPAEGLPPEANAARRAASAGDWAAARSSAAALAKRFPASADVAALGGDALLGAGEPEAALASYARAARVRRSWPLARKAAFASDRTGKRAAASALIARHVAGEPDNPDALFALAARQAAQGQWKRTALLLDHAIALGAGHDPALLALRRDAARALGQAGDARRLAALLAELRPARLDKR